MKSRPSLEEALARALETPPPSWEVLLPVGFAGAPLRHWLTVRLSSDVDLASVREAVASRYRSEGERFEIRGRAITLEPRRIGLEVSGRLGDLPADDGGLQSAILQALLEAEPSAIASVTTERWTDTPFEEPPARISDQVTYRSY